MKTAFNDQDIVQMLGEDGEKAIEILFREHYTFLCRALVRIIPDEHIAEDMVQEVFLELWKRKDRLSLQISFKAYLRRAAINKALNYLRDNKIKWSEETPPTLAGTLPDGRQQLEAGELRELIDQAIDVLPEKCRLIFVLSRFEELSYQEIAQELNISVKTVENQISKALKWLRQTLGPYLPLFFLGFLSFVFRG